MEWKLLLLFCSWGHIEGGRDASGEEEEEEEEEERGNPRTVYTAKDARGKGEESVHSPILSKNISYTFTFNNEMKGFRTLSYGIIKNWCMSDFETEAPGLLE